MNKAPTVAITGSSGFLGTALVRHFLKRGWQVIALAREPQTAPTHPKVEHRSYDLMKPVSPKLLSGVDYLVHTAYIKTNGPLPQTDPNISGAKALLTQSRKATLKKNLFISSMSAHEEAISNYGKQKFAIESLFSSPNDIVLRPGLIIGNGGIVKSMASFIRKFHVVPLVGRGNQPLQIIAINDLVLAIEHSLLIDERRVLTVATPEIYSYKLFYRNLQKKLSTTTFLIPLPTQLLRLILRIASRLRLSVGIDEDNLKGLQKLQSTDTTKDLELLKIRPLSLKAALQKTRGL